MKKTLATLALTTILAGCSAGNLFVKQETPTEPTDTTSTVTEPATPVLSQTQFVDLSAQIVCLGVTQPTLDTMAKQAAATSILTKAKVTEESFIAYRAELEKDATKKSTVGYAIVGRASELCPTKDGTPVNAKQSTDANTTAPTSDAASPTPAAPAAEATNEAKPTEPTVTSTTEKPTAVEPVKTVEAKDMPAMPGTTPGTPPPLPPEEQ